MFDVLIHVVAGAVLVGGGVWMGHHITLKSVKQDAAKLLSPMTSKVAADVSKAVAEVGTAVQGAAVTVQGAAK